MEEFPLNLFSVFNKSSKKSIEKRQDTHLNEDKTYNIGDEITKKVKVQNGKYVFHQVYV